MRAIVILIVLFAATASSQNTFTDGPILPTLTVATLPSASSASGKSFYVTDSATGCTVGSGSALALCRSNGTSWVAISGGGGGGTGNVGATVAVTSSATPTFSCPSSTAGTVVKFNVSALATNITGSTLSGCTGSSSLSSILVFVLSQPSTGGVYNYTWVPPTGFSGVCQIGQGQGVITTIEVSWDGTTGNQTSCNSTGPTILTEQTFPAGTPNATTEFLAADATLGALRSKNSSGLFFAMEKELNTGNVRVSQGAGAADRPAVWADIAALLVGTGCGTVTNGGQINGNCAAFSGGGAPSITTTGAAWSPLGITGATLQSSTCLLAAPCYWAFPNPYTGGALVTSIPLVTYTAAVSNDAIVFLMDKTCSTVIATSNLNTNPTPSAGSYNSFVFGTPPTLTDSYYIIGIAERASGTFVTNGTNNSSAILLNGGAVKLAFSGSNPATQAGGAGTAITPPSSCGTKTPFTSGTDAANPLSFLIVP